ncbi:MAG TPA: chemotaxis protein CheW [Xanthomonadaceae bacterium]|nr:chemotaxis protein CheW [Xanthomonadaceae bacterium]
MNATDRLATPHPHDVEVNDYIDALLAPVEDAARTAAAAAPSAADHAAARHAEPVPPSAPAMPTMPPMPPATPVARARPAPSPAPAATPDARPAAGHDAAEPGPQAQPARWLRVSVDGDRYALELLRVQEVVRLAPIIAMRGADDAVLGVMNLRGRIVPVWDLGRWLHAGEVRPDERARIVVVEHDDELIGLLVTSVDDVVSLTPDMVEPPYRPGTHRRRAADRATIGVARPGAVPTVLLDANALFE